MMKDITVKATIKRNDINASAKIAYIQNIDPSEPYTGSYDVTVLNTMTLPTNGKRMTGDLIIRQGADTYTGATTASVTDSDVVLNTANKLVSENITLKQGYPRYTGPYEMEVDLYGTHNFATKDKYLDQNIRVTQPYRRYSGPTTFTVTNSDIVQVIANEWYNGVIFINQGIPEFEGATGYSIVDNSITISTAGKRLSSNIFVSIADVEDLADEISEVVG